MVSRYCKLDSMKKKLILAFMKRNTDAKKQTNITSIDQNSYTGVDSKTKKKRINKNNVPTVSVIVSEIQTRGICLVPARVPASFCRITLQKTTKN